MPTLNAATERGDMFRSLLLSCTLFALLAGCGLNLGGVSVEFDEALEEELRTLSLIRNSSHHAADLR